MPVTLIELMQISKVSSKKSPDALMGSDMCLPLSLFIAVVCLHSLHDNKIIRHFRYHDKPITDIAMSPSIASLTTQGCSYPYGPDVFASVGEDEYCILWDARTPKPQV